MFYNLPPVPRDHPLHPALELAHRLDVIFRTLMQWVAIATIPLGQYARPVRHRLNRSFHRLRTILARLAEGTYPAPRRANPDAPPRPGGPPAPKLPHRRGWLGHVAGHHVRGVAGQLSHLLAQPLTHSILAAAPPHARAAFARALSTTARLLGVTLPAILQPAPRPPRQPRAPQPRPEPLPQHPDLPERTRPNPPRRENPA